jgi:hypothetical protein
VRKKDRWRTIGKLVQNSPFYYTELEVALFADDDEIRRKVSMTSIEDEVIFNFESAQAPSSVVVDPEVNFFRQLDPSEIPPSINKLKGADSILVVLSSEMGQDVMPVVNTLVLSLGLKNYKVVSEKKVSSTTLNNNNLILVGYSTMMGNFLSRVARNHNIVFSEKNFVLFDQTYDDPDDTFFGVFDHPFTEGRTVALYLPLTTQHADVVIRKVTHYGKYSYLAFKGNRNRVKGIWPVKKSPLIHQFRTGQ